MKAILTNFGSTGDFYPLLALASQLLQDGLQPIFAVPPFAHSLVRSAGFDCISIGPDLSSLRDEANVALRVHGATSSVTTSGLSDILAPIFAHMPCFVDELSDACSGASVLIGGGSQPLARIVHEVQGIPFVSVQLCHFGGNGGPELQAVGDEFVNNFRHTLRLPSVRDALTSGTNSPQLALYAMSAHLCPMGHLWPSHHHVIGFFYSPTAGPLNDSTREFLEQGTPPVVVTFGSMAKRQDSSLSEIVFKALLLTGQRGIVQGLCSTSTCAPGPQILFAEWLPHREVFSRASCVVCHGGAGTSAEVFRSGIPGIFVPFGDFFDQRYWAQLAFERGCAVSPIPYSALTPESLAAGIIESISNQQLRENARMLGARVRAENGTRTASRLIAQLLATMGSDD